MKICIKREKEVLLASDGGPKETEEFIGAGRSVPAN
jgi:hypothetical protein